MGFHDQGAFRVERFQLIKSGLVAGAVGTVPDRIAPSCGCITGHLQPDRNRERHWPGLLMIDQVPGCQVLRRYQQMQPALGVEIVPQGIRNQQCAVVVQGWWHGVCGQDPVVLLHKLLRQCVGFLACVIAQRGFLDAKAGQRHEIQKRHRGTGTVSHCGAPSEHPQSDASDSLQIDRPESEQARLVQIGSGHEDHVRWQPGVQIDQPAQRLCHGRNSSMPRDRCVSLGESGSPA
ncbi:hypothetical protein FQZ97_953860 [compost metagenome]